MKKVIVLLTVLFSSYSFADGRCPNLNGVFEVSSISAMRFTQNNCNTLDITWGSIQENGKIEWSKSSSQKAWINGPATCNAAGCVIATADARTLEMSRDIPWAHENAEHGACSFSQVSYSTDAKGNLLGQHEVFKCSDNYAGPTEVVYRRLN